MKLSRHQFLHLAAGAAALPAVLRLAHAQTYPTRPVRIVVGFAADGGKTGGVPKNPPVSKEQSLLSRLTINARRSGDATGREQDG
jgi:hypothetical protein